MPKKEDYEKQVKTLYENYIFKQIETNFGLGSAYKINNQTDFGLLIDDKNLPKWVMQRYKNQIESHFDNFKTKQDKKDFWDEGNKNETILQEEQDKMEIKISKKTEEEKELLKDLDNKVEYMPQEDAFLHQKK